MGTTPRVKAVANARPNMMAMAIDSHIGPPLKYKGTRPPIVVAVVNRMGRNRFWADSMTARAGG